MIQHHTLKYMSSFGNMPSVFRCCTILARTNVVGSVRQYSSGHLLRHLRSPGQCRLGRALLPLHPAGTAPRGFHTSQPHFVNPFFLLIFKPIVKVASILTGRTARRVFQQLPDVQKQLWKRRIRTAAPYVAGGVVGLGVTNYVLHIQETPITKRKRYIAFTPEQFMKIAQYEYELQWSIVKDQTVKPSHPYYKSMERVANRIINANQDIAFFKNQEWTLILVDSEERNAFVLPTGHIFVYRGLMDTVQNEDQLAVVMGHEMAHAVLMHGAERMSLASFVEYLVILCLCTLWFVLPNDGIAIVTQWFFNKVVTLMLSLPYDRKLENEADDVGLELIAKACYDVRESCNFWDLMRFLQETADKETEIPEIFSTHPSNETRIARLAEMLPKAICTRESHHCPRLSERDPHATLQQMKAVILASDAGQENQVQEEAQRSPPAG